MKSAKTYQDGAIGMIQWCNDFVWIPIYPEGTAFPVWTRVGELPNTPNKETGKSYDSLWKEQQEVLHEALEMNDGRFKHRLIVFCWQRGEGKCQRKGSKILMYDGTIKKVEDVVVGDLLMGDDNTPRKVLSLVNGKEELFQVTPMRGEPLFVTADHMLSLKHRRRALNKRGKPYIDVDEGKEFDITVRDFLQKNVTFRNLNALYRVPINWPKQKVLIEPYFLGLWLGDGHSTRPSITTMDQEVVDYLHSYATRLCLYVSMKGKGDDNKAKTYDLISNAGMPNILLQMLRQYKLINNKRIPQEYKANSREVRLKVLAGLVDTDGFRNRNSIGFILKSKELSEDILFLARSLGFHAEMKSCIKKIPSTGFEGAYYRIGISGDCSIIPTLIPRKKCDKRSDWKNHLVSTIKEVKSVGIDEYYGFTLDGNGRYVTEDFTVTHNSALACLVQMWKFFNFPRQQIVLGANSKDQVKFVHFDIIKDIVLNSPPLLNIVGRRNIQEKEIRLVDSKGVVRSVIRSISSFSGIVSNITGYTFSEIFDMKNPKFFVQLDGSIRNIPNALGVIDSTVSSKTHVLYDLYTAALYRRTKALYFSHRYSKEADVEDYWNPNMTQEQLDDYKAKFPPAEFDRYFKNTWSSGSQRLFSDEMIEEMFMFSIAGKPFLHLEMRKMASLICRKENFLETDYLQQGRGKEGKTKEQATFELMNLRKDVTYMDSFYSLTDEMGKATICPVDVLMKLGDLLDTNWAIMVGADLSDPMAMKISANSVVTCIAKGLPYSRIHANTVWEMDVAPKYVYIILHIAVVTGNIVEGIKQTMDMLEFEYGGIEQVTAERYGAWDLSQWCEERNIPFEALFPNYGKQTEGFNELYRILNDGRIKCPKPNIRGAKTNCILKEEFQTFDHDPEKKWFGSTEKLEKGGIQDDLVFSMNWCIYGGRNLTVDDFRSLEKKQDFGQMYYDKNLHGKY